MKPGNTVKSAAKVSSTAKAKGKHRKQSHSQKKQPNIDQRGAASGFSRTPNVKSRDDRAKALADCLKLDAKKDKKKTSGGSLVSSKAGSPRSQATPLHSPSGKLLNKLKQPSTTPSTPTTEFRKVSEARSRNGRAHAPDKSSNQSDTKKGASPAPAYTSAMHSAKSDQTPLNSPSGRRHKAVSKDNTRSVPGEENVKKQASPPSGHQPFSKEDRNVAPANLTGVSRSPSVLQSSSSPVARTIGSVSAESRSPTTPSSPQNDHRRAYVVGSLGLASPSLLTYTLGRRRIPATPEDILKLLNEDEPRARTVNVPDYQAAQERPRFVLGSNLRELYRKFTSPSSLSALGNPLGDGETADSSSALRRLASRKSSAKTGRAQSVGRRQSYRQVGRKTYRAESPGSVSSKAASKYSSKCRRPDGNLCSKDIIADGRAPEDQMEASFEQDGDNWKKLKGVQGVPLLVLAAFAVAALCAAIYSVRLLWNAKASAAQALMANFPDAMYRFCNSRSCKSAVREIEESANTSVIPCHDLYSFACGKWNLTAKSTDIAGLPASLSYMQALEQAFVDQVDHQLLSSTRDSSARKIGVVYKSCVTFHTNTSAQLPDMWPAAHVDPDRWLAAADHVHLFDMVIESVLTSHLSSIVSLIYHANATVDVRIGPGILDKSLFTLRQYMMRTTENLPGNDLYRARQADIKKLNDAVHAIYNQHAGIPNPLVTVRANEFDRDPVAALFSVPIARHMSHASKPAPSVIRYPDDSSVEQMLHIFRQVDVKLAAVYLLHVPFADFVNHEKETSVLRGNYGHFKTRSICTDFVHALFKNAFHPLIPTSPHTSESQAYLNALWKRIQEAGSGRPYAGGVRLKEDPVLPNATIALHGTIGNNDEVPDGALSTNYGDDFIVNIIRYTFRTGIQVRLDFKTSWPEDAVEPKLLQKPFYYSEAKEPFINYATLGVRVAQLLFEQSLTRSALVSPRVAACFSTYGRSHMRVMFDGREWPRYVGLAWALETAMDAALGARRRSAELERFMIIRFARTYCGEEATARQALTYAVKSSTTFARAFGCAEPPFPYC